MSLSVYAVFKFGDADWEGDDSVLAVYYEEADALEHVRILEAREPGVFLEVQKYEVLNEPYRPDEIKALERILRPMGG